MAMLNNQMAKYPIAFWFPSYWHLVLSTPKSHSLSSYRTEITILHSKCPEDRIE